jgi:IS5 family transposase
LQAQAGGPWLQGPRRNDQDAKRIQEVEITTANVHDAAELEAMLPSQPGDVYGDSTYASSRSERVIAAAAAGRARCKPAFGGERKRSPACRLTTRRLQAARARIDEVFGTCKHSYGLLRMRLLGLAKAGLQVRLTAIAYDLRRSWRLLQLLQS